MPTDENFKLTVNELKQMTDCENIEERQALEMIETMFMMSIFAFNAYKQEKNNML